MDKTTQTQIIKLIHQEVIPAIGNPTIPVPGIPTPIAFFRMLALRNTSVFSGLQPKTSAALAVA